MNDYYPSEIHKLLKIGANGNGDAFPAEHMDLPIMHEDTPVHTQPAENAHTHAQEHPKTVLEAAKLNKLKTFLAYPIIFIVAFAFFYIALNFSSLWAQVQGSFTKPQAQQVLGSNSAEYYKWISNYFYAVGDAKLLEPSNDLDKDGLSNQDEFTIKTNPILADSDGDGTSDGIEALNSTNLWGDGAMTKQQKDLVAKLDLIVINNRISGNIAVNHGTVAGTATAVSATANYDLEKPGLLAIPKLRIQVPLVWSKDPADFDADLTHGVIHYPGTALPGENGVDYISGHSSDYFWKKDPMHDVFAKLNFLSAGDDIFITVYGKDGKVYNYRYQVAGNQIYKPDDQAQFFDSTTTSKLNLSTCWPIGTSKDRLVVSAVAVPL